MNFSHLVHFFDQATSLLAQKEHMPLAEYYQDLDNLFKTLDIQKVREALASTKHILDQQATSISNLNQAIETYQAHQKRLIYLAEIVDNTEDFATIKDLDCRIVAANQALLNASDKKMEDIIGKTDIEVFGDNEVTQKYLKDDQRAQQLAKGESIVREEPFIYPNGQIKMTLVKKFPVFNEDGELIGTANISRDITQRKLNEIELKRYRDQLEKLVKQRTKELEKTNKELQDQISERLLAEEKIKEQNAEIQQQSEELEAINEELSAANETLNLLNEDLRYAKEQAEFINRFAPSAIMTLNQDMLITGWNERATEITGYQDYEVIGKKCFLFDECEQGCPLFSEKISKPIINQECALVRKDGKKRIVLKSIDYLKDKRGNIIGGIETFEDVTRQREASERLKQSEKKLRELNATKDKFFSIVAHDLKNPFTILIGFSDMLRRHADSMPKEKKANYHDLIHKTSKQGFNLLQNLLEWSRSQTGRLNWNPEKIRLEALVLEIVDFLRSGANKKGISINYEIDESYFVYVDANMVNTVLRNLVSNALKFTEENGQISITAQDRGAVIEVAVEDTGIGIKNNNLSKLFRIDESYSTTGTANEKGTGLGLILCKEFIERNGGEIWVESTWGRGSTFYFTLPKEKLTDKNGNT